MVGDVCTAQLLIAPNDVCYFHTPSPIFKTHFSNLADWW